MFVALNDAGVKATDATRDALVKGLETIEEATEGGVVRRVTEKGRSAFWEMNATVAKEMLKRLAG